MSHNFIHFRVQSSYSMLESTLTIPRILSLVSENQMPAVALTDRNNLFASLEFALAAVKKGIQPIHGAILNLQYFHPEHGERFSEILLIAKDELGYKNLLQLVSAPYTKNDRSNNEHITLEDLFTYSEGIVVLSGYINGLIGQFLLENRPDLAEEYARKLQKRFEDRFYFEVMRIGKFQHYSIEDEYVELALKLDIPLIATNNVLFDQAQSYHTHDIFMRICNKGEAVSNKAKSNNQCYFKSSETMWDMFQDLPQAIENTICLSQRISFFLEATQPSLPSFAQGAEDEEIIIRKLAREGLLKRLKVTPTNEERKLYDPYFQRLDYELEVICNMNFAGYFLIVSDFIRWSKENGIFVGPGRGSGVGSVVAWSLFITDLDPIKFGLLFERFLNPERVSMPDFDIDFCQERREEVIEYARNRYGENKVGQIITFGKMQAKAVIKDAARVLGLRYHYANYITTLIPFSAVNPITLEEAIKKVSELHNASIGKGIYNLHILVKADNAYLNLVKKWEEITYNKIQQILDENDKIRQYFLKWKTRYNYEAITESESLYLEVIEKCQKFKLDNLAEQFESIYNDYQKLLSDRKAQIQDVIKVAIELEGLNRHISVHAAGIVIGSKDLIEILPLYKDKNSSMHVVQYSMKYAELAGLVKFDFLGLQTLTVIAKCLNLLKKKSIIIDINEISFNDKNIYHMLSQGRTAGVFQFESIGMRDSLKRLKPDCIEDLIALGALYRPGPMENIPTYIACKHGKAQPNYLHPKLEPILKETYGVIIYQEQVMEIARILAQYTLGSADLLRRAMGKKIKAEMDAQKSIFIQGAVGNGIPKSQAEEIFYAVDKFAGYGFNKSHAAAYAILSYQTAYLKANYTAEFLVTCLNLEINDKVDLFINEAKKMNIKIIAPDINLSEEYFTISQEGDIIFGLAGIKNVTPSVGNLIVEERSKNGKFTSILNFAERMLKNTVNKKLLESLINAGCFDSLHDKMRFSLIQSIDRINSYAIARSKEKHVHQFSLLLHEDSSKGVLLSGPDYELLERASKEFEVLGIFLTCHPCEMYKNILDQHKIFDSNYIFDQLPLGTHTIKLSGVIQKKDSRMSSRGRFHIIQLSDHCGIFEVTIFNENIFKKYISMLEVGNAVVVRCEVNKDEGGVKMSALSFDSLFTLNEKTNYNLRLFANSFQELENLLALLNKGINEEKSNTKVKLMLPYLNQKFTVIIDINKSLFFSTEQIQLLEKFVSV